MKKSIFFAAAMVLASAVQAGPIKVVYAESATPLQIVGSFTGADLNDDGLLTYNELTAWSISYSPIAKLADLNAFGDYDIRANKWIANAVDVLGNVDAFATWQRRSMAVTSQYFSFTTFQVPLAASPDSLPGNPVPEPASLALAAIGAAALGLRRRRSA